VERPQNLGVLLMAVSAVQMIVFTIGVMRRSYLALALPVLAAMGALSAVLFWVGYTMAGMESDLGELDMQDEEEFEAAPAV
jgi:hypothetical protein